MVRHARQLAQKARQQRFHALVTRVVRELPDDVQQMLNNVAIVVEDEPTPDHLEDAGLEPGDELFGLYQGVPTTERDSGYSLAVPDRILIFLGPLERSCASRQEFEEQVRITVLHELGHHLGFDEDGLDQLGLA